MTGRSNDAYLLLVPFPNDKAAAVGLKDTA
jgi:hypothetical protein